MKRIGQLALFLADAVVLVGKQYANRVPAGVVHASSADTMPAGLAQAGWFSLIENAQPSCNSPSQAELSLND